LSDMLAIQDSLLKASAKELLITDLLPLSSMEQAKHTEYEPNSYVLVHYRTGAPPTRLHIFLEKSNASCVWERLPIPAKGLNLSERECTMSLT
jgi:hypothetical protein